MSTLSDWTPSEIEKALEVRAAVSLASTANKVKALKDQGVSEGSILSDQVQSDLLQVSKRHTEFFIFTCFKDGIKQAADTAKLDAKTCAHLTNLLSIYGLQSLSDDLLHLMMGGYLQGRQGPLVEEALKGEIKRIRGQLLPLVEALAPPDSVVFSAIGSKTNPPYETLLEWTKKHNPINKEELLPGFKEYMLPLMKPKL